MASPAHSESPMVISCKVCRADDVGNIGASFQTLFGGNITLYTSLAERARQEAFDELCLHAEQVGANAVIAMRYDANEITPGVTEVLAYGTAVVVEKLPD